MIFGSFSSPYNDKKNQIQITIFFALGIIQNYEILKKKRGYFSKVIFTMAL